MESFLWQRLLLAAEQPRGLGAIYEREAPFVWRSLHRLGVDERDLPDLTQEVFVVAHRRQDSYDRLRPLRPWLFGICARVARNHRRHAFRRAEQLSCPEDEPRADPNADTEAELERRRARERGRRLLEGLDPEKRAVFVMFEVEGMPGAAIAEALGVPLGTVHSRLHAARRELQAALAKEAHAETAETEEERR